MGNSLHQLFSCSSSSSAATLCIPQDNDALCMPRGSYSLGSRCGSVAAAGKARVVHTGLGEVMEANEGTTAAELMMEHPNHFLICSTATTVEPGKRFTPLASHHELARNHIYFLLPMHKLRCRLSTKDLLLLAQLSSELKHVPSSDLTRIQPFISPPSISRERATGEVTLIAEQVMQPSVMASGSPWRPSLQTIDESPHLRCSSWTATQVFRPQSSLSYPTIT